MCFLSIPGAFYFPSTCSTYRITYQWKVFVICHQNKAIKSLSPWVDRDIYCEILSQRLGTPNIPFFSEAAGSSSPSKKGEFRNLPWMPSWCQGSKLLGPLLLGTLTLIAVYVLKRIWIMLQHFLHYSLTLHDWYSSFNNVCLVAFLHERLWYLSIFISVDLCKQKTCSGKC